MPLVSWIGVANSALGITQILGVPPGGSFNLTGANPGTNTSVDLTFDHALAVTPALTSPGSYSINNGMTVFAVAQISPTQVRLFTTPQVPGVVYTVTVSLVILDTSGDTLSVRTATFTGLAEAPPYLVSDLVSNSVCSGRAISLTWTNPTSPQAPASLLIVRRLRAWPFDLSDNDYDIIYSGPPIESFVDTGIKTPVTQTTAPNAPGDTSLLVLSTASFNPGDSIRVENLEGPVEYDLVNVQSVVSTTELTTSTPLTNTYPTGARVSENTQLQAQTYYYYLVLVSPTIIPAPLEILGWGAGGWGYIPWGGGGAGSAQVPGLLPPYDIGDDSQTFCLSIDDALQSTSTFLIPNTPTTYIKQDQISVAEGGGGGYLMEWFAVMGCWLNLMRGYFNAIQLLNDIDKMPFHALTAKNQSLGIDPEGFSFDYDIVRRPLASLVFVYHRKGSCPGIIETVSMFTKWTATCVDFGVNGCNGGPSGLRTWDGQSQCSYANGPSPGQVSQTIIDDVGTATFTDTSATFTPHLYLGGKLKGWIGDIACITDNATSTQLTMTAPQEVTTLVAPASIGATTLSVASTSGLDRGVDIQITSLVAPFKAEIVQVYTTSPGTPGSLSLQGPGLVNAYPAGAMISIGKSIIRAEYTGTPGSTAAGQVITDPYANWNNTQWTRNLGQYKLLDSANVLHNVVSNTGFTVTVDGAPPASGEYSIAFGFNVGASFAARVPILAYRIENGVHATLVEPTEDVHEVGTGYDPFNRLYNGPGLNLNGAWGPGDVGVYILGNIPVAQGKATTVSGSTFTLDVNEPAVIPGALVGDYLNPNQNQEQLFEILANSATTVTVAGDVSSLVVPNQAYVVLTKRDKIRFQRVTARLRTEFTDTDVRIHVLFV